MMHWNPGVQASSKFVIASAGWPTTLRCLIYHERTDWNAYLAGPDSPNLHSQINASRIAAKPTCNTCTHE